MIKISMKVYTSLLFIFISSLVFSQNFEGSVDYTLTVKDTKRRPMSGEKVIFTEIDSRQKIFKRTDASGKLNILLKGGKEWLITIGQIRNEWNVEVPERGEAVSTRTITYNYERWKRENRPPVDRNALGLVNIEQTIGSKDMPDEKNGILTLKITERSGAPIKHYKIGATCYALKKTYTTTTDKYGKARFKLPLSNEYQIDIDGIEEYQYYEMKHLPAFYSMEFNYEPSNVIETAIGDTITQELGSNPTSSSNRAYYKIRVKKRGVDFVKDEPVYLKMLKSNKVYKAKTNKDGEVDFLLPVHRKYLIDFNYEKDVDVVDLSKTFGFVSGEMNTNYFPQEKLEFPERFIPESHEVFVTHFDEFIDKQYPEPEEHFLELYARWTNPEVNELSKESLLEIGFSSRNKETLMKNMRNSNTPPINVCFVIDKSGSMSGYDRIESLQKSLLELSALLRPTDIVSLVVFNGSAQVSVPAQKYGNGEFVREMFRDIEAGGGTSIYEGLVKGFEEVNKYAAAMDASKVILLTDGYGSRPITEVVQLAKKHIDEGIEVSCIGVGETYNQALLSQLASTGGGLMHFVGDAKNMTAAFTKEMISSLYPVAGKATIEVFFNDNLIYKQLYGYDAKNITNGQFNMELKNIYPGLNKLALVHFDLNQPTKAIEKDPLMIRMTYFDYQQNKKIVQEKRVKLQWSDKTGEIDYLIDRNHKKLLAIAMMNRAIKVMAEYHGANENQKAKSVIESSISEVKKIFPDAQDQDVLKLMNELISYTNSLNQLLRNQQLKGN
ncbi:MAG TPA: hypothetical protein DCF89_13060 [Flavobacteriales bacterium]|nr:hypothetical protein [Flavobacteriales bacterium]